MRLLYKWISLLISSLSFSRSIARSYRVPLFLLATFLLFCHSIRIDKYFPIHVIAIYVLKKIQYLPYTLFEAFFFVALFAGDFSCVCVKIWKVISLWVRFVFCSLFAYLNNAFIDRLNEMFRFRRSQFHSIDTQRFDFARITCLSPRYVFMVICIDTDLD